MSVSNGYVGYFLSPKTAVVPIHVLSIRNFDRSGLFQLSVWVSIVPLSYLVVVTRGASSSQGSGPSSVHQGAVKLRPR